MIKYLIFIFIFIFFCSNINAQDNSFYYTEKKYNAYIEYLIAKGLVNFDHPLSQPYKCNILAIELNKIDKNYLNQLLIDDINKFNRSLSFNNNFLNETKHSDNTFEYDYSLSLNGKYQYKNIVTQYGYTVNSKYKKDTIFFSGTGKLENKKSSRSNTSYLGYNLKNFNLLIGRIGKNFGYINQYSLIKSDNPLPYDDISFNLFNKKIKYVYTLTRLEDSYSYDSRENLIQYNWNKRYLNFHRIELNINKKIKMAISESVLYGGENQNLVPFYINPINIYFLSKMNDRSSYEETNANILGTFEIYYNTFKNSSFFMQFLIDDMDFTKSLRSQFPDRIGINLLISLTDFLTDKSNLKIGYKYLSNYTYNSYYTFGNYTFYDRSIGYPKNGFKEIAIEYDFFKIKKTIYTFGSSINTEKEQNLETHYAPELNNFVEERNLKIDLTGSHFFNNNIDTNIKFEFMNIKNFQNLKGHSKNLLNIYINFNIRFNFNPLSKQ